MSSQDGTLNDIFAIKVSDLPETLLQAVEAEDLVSAGAALQEGMKLEWDAVFREVAEKFAQLLDMNVKDILAATWSKYKVLAEHAERTRASPGESVLVPLTKHTIESEHHPLIEVLVSEASLLKLEFEILLTLDLEGALVTIEDGKITRIQPGEAKGKASVSCRDKKLLEKVFDAAVLPATLTLDPGVEIPSSDRDKRE